MPTHQETDVELYSLYVRNLTCRQYSTTVGNQLLVVQPCVVQPHGCYSPESTQYSETWKHSITTIMLES